MRWLLLLLLLCLQASLLGAHALEANTSVFQMRRTQGAALIVKVSKEADYLSPARLEVLEVILSGQEHTPAVGATLEVASLLAGLSDGWHLKKGVNLVFLNSWLDGEQRQYAPILGAYLASPVTPEVYAAKPELTCLGFTLSKEAIQAALLAHLEIDPNLNASFHDAATLAAAQALQAKTPRLLLGDERIAVWERWLAGDNQLLALDALVGAYEMAELLMPFSQAALARTLPASDIEALQRLVTLGLARENQWLHSAALALGERIGFAKSSARALIKIANAGPDRTLRVVWLEAHKALAGLEEWSEQGTATLVAHAINPILSDAELLDFLHWLQSKPEHTSLAPILMRQSITRQDSDPLKQNAAFAFEWLFGAGKTKAASNSGTVGSHEPKSLTALVRSTDEGDLVALKSRLAEIQVSGDAKTASELRRLVSGLADWSSLLPRLQLMRECAAAIDAKLPAELLVYHPLLRECMAERLNYRRENMLGISLADAEDWLMVFGADNSVPSAIDQEALAALAPRAFDPHAQDWSLRYAHPITCPQTLGGQLLALVAAEKRAAAIKFLLAWAAKSKASIERLFIYRALAAYGEKVDTMPELPSSEGWLEKFWLISAQEVLTGEVTGAAKLKFAHEIDLRDLLSARDDESEFLSEGEFGRVILARMVALISSEGAFAALVTQRATFWLNRRSGRWLGYCSDLMADAKALAELGKRWQAWAATLADAKWDAKARIFTPK